jgi:hypothetical protein
MDYNEALDSYGHTFLCPISTYEAKVFVDNHLDNRSKNNERNARWNVEQAKKLNWKNTKDC